MVGWMDGWMQKYKITERHSTHYAMSDGLGGGIWLNVGMAAVVAVL